MTKHSNKQRYSLVIELQHDDPSTGFRALRLMLKVLLRRYQIKFVGLDPRANESHGKNHDVAKQEAH